MVFLATATGVPTGVLRELIALPLNCVGDTVAVEALLDPDWLIKSPAAL